MPIAEPVNVVGRDARSRFPFLGRACLEGVALEIVIVLAFGALWAHRSGKRTGSRRVSRLVSGVGTGVANVDYVRWPLALTL